MKTLKTIILVLLMAISVQSFSQARFSKRKYTKGIFTEKHHRIKIPASDQEVIEMKVFEKADIAEYPDASIDSIADVIPGISENTIAVNEKMTRSDIQPLENFKSTAKNDAYGSIPKHNTTRSDQRQYADISASATHVACEFQVQTTKSWSRIHERTFSEKAIYWLKNNASLYLLWIIILAFVTAIGGFWALLFVVLFSAASIFIGYVLIMAFLKLFIPDLEMF